MATIAAVMAFAGACQAREGCNEDGYRVTHTGDRIPTTACQAQLFGKVARAHKIRIRNSGVLKNPEARHELCHLIGRDPRIEVACQLRENLGR